jgi:ArsR family transcriptional regulator
LKTDETKKVRSTLPPRERTADALELALICKAASDPLRLEIMRVLKSDSFGVQELAALFSMPQPGMSHHLKVLASSGLLVTRRQGNSIFYMRTLLHGDDMFQDFRASLFAAIDSRPLAEERLAKIEAIHRERAQQSRLYFNRHVDQFEESQGMICELGQYLPSLVEVLDLMGLPTSSRVMEVGPGQGQILQELARRFDVVVALDNSLEMLAFTKGKIAINERIKFIESSLESYEPNGDSFDAVVLNMVLHHISSPVQALQKLRQIVRPRGYLLIADLCPHHQEWATTSCGDLWLGFDPHDLKNWAIEAGFVEDQSLYLGLKNGFQIQVKLFHAT